MITLPSTFIYRQAAQGQPKFYVAFERWSYRADADVIQHWCEPTIADWESVQFWQSPETVRDIGCKHCSERCPEALEYLMTVKRAECEAVRHMNMPTTFYHWGSWGNNFYVTSGVSGMMFSADEFYLTCASDVIQVTFTGAV